MSKVQGLQAFQGWFQTIVRKFSKSNVPIFQGSKNSASLEPSNAKTLDVSSLEILELSNLTFQLCNLNRGTHGVSRMFPKLQGSKEGLTVPKRPRAQHFQEFRRSRVPGVCSVLFGLDHQKKTRRYTPVEKTVALFMGSTGGDSKVPGFQGCMPGSRLPEFQRPTTPA